MFFCNCILAMCLALKLLNIKEEQLLVIGNDDGSIALFSIDFIHGRVTLLNTSRVHTDSILSIAVLQGKNMLAVAGTSKKISILSFNNSGLSDQVASIALPNVGVSSLEFSPDGAVLAAGCWDYRVRLIDTTRYTIISTLKFHNSNISSISFNTSEAPQFYFDSSNQDRKNPKDSTQTGPDHQSTAQPQESRIDSNIPSIEAGSSTDSLIKNSPTSEKSVTQALRSHDITINPAISADNLLIETQRFMNTSNITKRMLKNYGNPYLLVSSYDNRISLWEKE
ncbi:Protein DECREASED SIZE EXCLUSION LIMIT 1 [Smittium culicis]|uniref:ASTRA-associated protein 1 n=1 Tax=Smittium culicis TaxID=133412 RepID=A0A1R1YBX8_9FUNG|nr:Protein DECREASED SIZE EXCLUSION LIMIT 1 [Smittium culicis]